MSIDASLFNQAMRVFQEFGPKRQVPRDERLKQEFPQLTEADIRDLVRQFRRIEADAYAVAERVRDGRLAEQKGPAKVKAAHPLLSEEMAAITFTQAMYFVHK